MLSPSSTALEVVLQLASEPAVVAYFAFIGLSLRHILRASRSWPPLALAGAIVVVTWFYIGRYTVEYERSGKTNLFNDAYADVSTPSAWLLSSQLLTWVVVATIWTRDASFSYMLFGMLGAMSAAFVPWVALLDGRPNASTPPRTARPSAASQAVPISYALCALVSLVSVSALPRTLSESGESTLGFGLWLKLLHLALLAPRAVPLLLRHETSVDAFALYALLALALGGWHLSQLPSGGIFPLPVTDCQVSISCDLLCCAALTCYAIWRRTKSQCALALAVPLCAFASPGFVLAAWQACEHWPRVHTRLVRAMQAKVAARLSGGAGEAREKTARWMNLGLWDGGEEPEEDEAAAGKGGGKGGGSPLGGYESACERLAALLGDAASIDGTDGVLVCGCGSGAELALYASRFSPFHMTGIDAHEPNATAFVRRHNLRLLHMDVEAFGDELAPQLDESVARPPLWTPRLPIGLYTKILALDNAYHYADKERWLADSAALLRAGGAVAFTDVCLRRPAAETPLWVRALLAAANIPLRNHWGADEYQTRLGELGYTAVSCESIGDAVLPKWISSSLIKWVDYVLVVGTLPRPSTPTARPTVAVVGAGLSGLTAAHLLSPTRVFFFAHRTHFSHMSHPTFPISHRLFLFFKAQRDRLRVTRQAGAHWDADGLGGRHSGHPPPAGGPRVLQAGRLARNGRVPLLCGGARRLLLVRRERACGRRVSLLPPLAAREPVGGCERRSDRRGRALRLARREGRHRSQRDARGARDVGGVSRPAGIRRAALRWAGGEEGGSGGGGSGGGRSGGGGHGGGGHGGAKLRRARIGRTLGSPRPARMAAHVHLRADPRVPRANHTQVHARAQPRGGVDARAIDRYCAH